MIYTGMESSEPFDLKEIAQLQVPSNSSCCCIVNVIKTLSPDGANTLVDSCRLSVSTTVERPNQTLVGEGLACQG